MRHVYRSSVALLAWISIMLLAAHCSTGRVFIQEVDDSAITTQIVSLLIQDTQINHLNIKVITDEGEVFLIGNVPDRNTRIRAEEHARSIENVWSVINYLRVGPENQNNPESDLAIKAGLVKELSLLGEVPFVIIAIHVHNAEVYLIGRVNSEKDRQALMNTAYSQEGIRDVHEHLKLGSRLQ